MWNDEMVRIVRYLITDICQPYTYNDDRLEETIIVSAQLVQTEIDFDTTYTIDIDGATISPDPVDANDNGFINLVSLKTSIIVLMGELKEYALNSVRIVDGPSSIDFTDVVRNKKAALDAAIAMYNKAKIDYQSGNSRAGAAILSPYTNEQISPYYPNY